MNLIHHWCKGLLLVDSSAASGCCIAAGTRSQIKPVTEIAMTSNETAYPLTHYDLVTQPPVMLARGQSSKSYIHYMPIVHYKIHNSIPSYSSSRPQIFRLPWYSVLGGVVDLRDLDMLSLLKILRGREHPRRRPSSWPTR